MNERLNYLVGHLDRTLSDLKQLAEQENPEGLAVLGKRYSSIFGLDVRS